MALKYFTRNFCFLNVSSSGLNSGKSKRNQDNPKNLNKNKNSSIFKYLKIRKIKIWHTFV